jgi:hypothetical protein
MKKKEESCAVGAAEGGRRPTGAAPTDRGGKGRFNSQRMLEFVLQLLRVEELDALSRELGVMATTLAGWKEVFLGAGLSRLKSRESDSRDD